MSESRVFSALKAYVESTFLVSLEGELTPDSNLFDAGVIDSYGVVEMVGHIEREFGVSFTDEELLSPKLASVRGISELVDHKLAASPDLEESHDLQAVRSS
jgi:D-alanine--poly(phosphoribitol) ligase subunit 2